MALEPGIYRHFKGNLYFVSGVATRTDDDSEDVVYYPLYPSEHKMFTQSKVRFEKYIDDREDYKGPRFIMVERHTLPNILPGQKIQSNLQSYACGKIVRIYLGQIRTTTSYTVGQSPSGVDVLVDLVDHGKKRTVTWRDFWSFYNVR